MSRYEVIRSRAWHHTDGRTASIYGAVPYQTEAEAEAWVIVDRGFTVRDLVSGTVGIGRKPWDTEAEALAWVAAEEARIAACWRALSPA